MAAIVEEFSPGKSQTNQYPAPQEILGEIPEREYPLEALPESIRQSVEEVQGYVKAPMALVSCNALGIASLATQGLAKVRSDKQLVSNLSLYLLILAESGERKTFTEKFFLHGVERWVAEQLRKLETKVKDYEADLAAWKSEVKGTESRIASCSRKSDIDGLKSAREELRRLIETKPEKPLIPKLKYTDATHEALVSDKGLSGYPVGGILTSEGGGFFGGSSFHNDSIMAALAKYNDLWSGDTITIDRKGDGSVNLRDVALILSVAVQPAVMDKFLAKTGVIARESGFLARALIAYPSSTQGFREFTEAPEAMPATDQFNARIHELLELLPDHINDAGRLDRVTLELSPEAKELWVKYYNLTESNQRQGGSAEFIRPEAARSADNARRIAGIFHVFEHGTEGEVSAAHMKAGCDIAHWHLHEARRFMATSDAPEQFTQARKLSARIAAFCLKRKAEGAQDWQTIKTRQLLRSPCKVAGVKDQKTLKPVILELLEAYHLLEWDVDSKNGAGESTPAGVIAWMICRTG